MIFQQSRYYKKDINRSNKGHLSRQVTSTPGIIEHTVAFGERLEHIADTYYNDASLWWAIVDANSDISSAVEFHLSDQTGRVILIPEKPIKAGR